MEQLSPNQYNKQNTDTDQDVIHTSHPTITGKSDDIIFPRPDIYLVEVEFSNSREIGTFIVEHMELYEGDLVYVTGPMQNKIGTIIDVTIIAKFALLNMIAWWQD